MELRVVVRVHVDEAGRHEQAVGIDHPSGALVDATDGDDASVAYSDIGGARRGTGAVDDRAPSDQEVTR